jgi:hypothetical protein
VPERLDRVAISTNRGTVEIPWASHDKLLHEIRHLDGADATRHAFDAVGASRPVPLSRVDKALLVEAIEAWAHAITVDELPEGVWRLRNALAGE